MDQVIDSKNCTGCRACEKVCPRHCIRFEQDEEGFITPRIQADSCTHCHACRAGCPQQNAVELNPILESYAFIHRKSVVMMSSSGGAFTWFAESVIRNGGVVFATRLDMGQRNAYVTACETLGDMEACRKSVYFQSDTNSSYESIRERLHNSIRVLFCGTPCQCAGLRRYLQGDPDGLITVDLLCHGVPSATVFQAYIAYWEKKTNQRVSHVSFRSKAKFGWKLATEITFARKRKMMLADCDRFMAAYKQAVHYREVCYHCEYAGAERVGDITIGDFWGAESAYPALDTRDGVSAVMVNTAKGWRFFQSLDPSGLTVLPADTDTIIRNNGTLTAPTGRSGKRDWFYKDLNTLGFAQCIRRNVSVKPMFYSWVLMKCPKRVLNALGRFKGNLNQISLGKGTV